MAQQKAAAAKLQAMQRGRFARRTAAMITKGDRMVHTPAPGPLALLVEAVVGAAPQIKARRRWGEKEIRVLATALRPLVPVTDAELAKAGVESRSARRRVLSIIGDNVAAEQAENSSDDERVAPSLWISRMQLLQVCPHHPADSPRSNGPPSSGPPSNGPPCCGPPRSKMCIAAGQAGRSAAAAAAVAGGGEPCADHGGTGGGARVGGGARNPTARRHQERLIPLRRSGGC